MDSLKYIAKKYNLDLNSTSPIEIANIGRNNLPELFTELGFTKGVEVGTERGLFAEVLLKNIPNLRLTCIDPWGENPEYRSHVSQKLWDEIFEDAKKRLSPYKAHLIKNTSLNAVNKFTDESLDFVYIDANHDYWHTTEDLHAWNKKVKKGGIIAGHDYIKTRQIVSGVVEKIEVVRAVNDFVKKNNIRPWFLIGLRAKIPGKIRDARRSYMWVKN